MNARDRFLMNRAPQRCPDHDDRLLPAAASKEIFFPLRRGFQGNLLPASKEIFFPSPRNRLRQWPMTWHG
ncbi:MAG: hypothetical protein OXT09_16400, partial [Myxococcales bacterium]|nr:hypothetical protein [Myxococcales bacterium]